VLLDLFPSLTLTCDVCRARVPGLGLRKVLKEGESVPEVFEDPVVKRGSRWVLSTSALFSTHLREYGWGEVRLTCPFFGGRRAILTIFLIQVVPDGFGVAYITGFDGM
jgi:carnitine O-acetyltransferase